MTIASRTDRPRLAYIVKYYYPMPRISGIITFVHDLVEALVPDFQIRVITSRYAPDATPQEQYRGYEIQRWGGNFPWQAGRATRKYNPDIIVFGSGFWRPWYLLPYWEIFRAALGPGKAPVVLTQYTNMTKRASFLLKGLIPVPEAIVALTSPEADSWNNRFNSRASFIPAGVLLNTKKTTPAPDFKPPAPGKIRIGYFGHLQPHKGPDRILQTFLNLDLPEVELLLHGEGEMETELKKMAQDRPNVIFKGYVPDPSPWIRSCSLVVLPYRSAVSVLGYSRAALEALAAGVPLLTTPTPAVAPLVEEGINGHICRDDTQLKAKLRELLENPEQLKKLSRGAVTSAQKYDILALAQQYRQLFYSLLESS